MSDATFAPGPWLAIVGLGLFHGVNPAMGWLFAVALGLHRHSQRVVLLSLMPIAVGHAVAVATVLIIILSLGLVLDWMILSRLTGVLLIGWAIWHALRHHRQRVRIGMRTGMAGLAVWSFLMASAHGAGLMLVPVIVPLCLSGTTTLTAGGSLPTALAALAVHTATMLAMIAVISVTVYRWIGVAFLKHGWINFDFLWIAALVVCGVLLIL